MAEIIATGAKYAIPAYTLAKKGYELGKKYFPKQIEGAKNWLSGLGHKVVNKLGWGKAAQTAKKMYRVGKKYAKKAENVYNTVKEVTGPNSITDAVDARIAQAKALYKKAKEPYQKVKEGSQSLKRKVYDDSDIMSGTKKKAKTEQGEISSTKEAQKKKKLGNKELRYILNRINLLRTNHQKNID